ncbi:signal transduction histidine kinase [Crinalium epipsammum PCC 9333]|uniref:Signal transduction histidine kinase n=1 Tax=Crinalium epipsammum PCC 9333 TaxID=1173022 RepID=K9W3N8_9CYAN|nr:PAS domain S-box protein [Crinalium epipsammum]AFZ14409.1 signal transduction histidine kinase [Crinalium epipsammum PCC 9333]
MNNQPLKNEATPLVAINQYQILDTEPEAAFDDIARLATLVCGTPIALINLIDGNRQWLKSNIGLNVKELPLVAGFCRICIEQGDVLLIADTLADEQFAINLVVQNHPHVRFYAGAPLITPDGNAIGTLCAIDTKPRELRAEQVEALRALSRQVVNLLELRRHVTELESMIALQQVTQSALQESEERYRSVVTAMQEGIVLHQADGTILTCNPSAERILGLSAEQIVGRTSVDPRWRTVDSDGSVFPGETYPAMLTLRTGKPCSNVVMGVHKPDGVITWISINSQPLYLPGETTPYAVVASFSDITAQKLAEAALQQANETLELKVQERTVLLQQAIEQLETEARSRVQAEETLNKEREFLKALLENLSDGIVVCDENGILTLFNRATRKFHGMPQQPLPPEEWAQLYDLYLPDGCTPMQKEDIPLYQALQGKTIRDVEMVIVPRQGKVRIVLASGQAIIDRHGKKLGAVLVMHDITAHKAIEAALIESESRLNSILNSIQDAVWSIAYDTFEILYLNPASEKLHARSRQDFFDNPYLWHEVIHPDDKDSVENYMKKLLETGSIEHEYRIIRADGEVRWANNKGWLVYDYTGKPVRIDGLASDITERKQAEDKLKASLQEKETLLKEVHHRVKNNLQIISSLLRLQSKQIRDADVLELFQESQNRVRTMALIHEKLYQSDNLAKIDFLEYIQTLIQELSRSYGASKQAIAFKLNIEKVHLEVDMAIPCGLIINELVSNSLKYAFKDRQTGEIDISLVQHSQSNSFILTISDNGVGLPQNLDFRKTQSLGLQLVCRLTKQLGGSINLNPSQGTAFQIIFPTPSEQEYN